VQFCKLSDACGCASDLRSEDVTRSACSLLSALNKALNGRFFIAQAYGVGVPNRCGCFRFKIGAEAQEADRCWQLFAEQLAARRFEADRV